MAEEGLSTRLPKAKAVARPPSPSSATATAFSQNPLKEEAAMGLTLTKRTMAPDWFVGIARDRPNIQVAPSSPRFPHLRLYIPLALLVARSKVKPSASMAIVSALSLPLSPKLAQKQPRWALDLQTESEAYRLSKGLTLVAKELKPVKLSPLTGGVIRPLGAEVHVLLL